MFISYYFRYQLESIDETLVSFLSILMSFGGPELAVNSISGKWGFWGPEAPVWGRGNPKASSRTEFYSKSNDQIVRAARLQNETAPEIFYIDTKNDLKKAKKDPKNDLKRVQKF